MVTEDLVERAMDREHAAFTYGCVFFQIWAGACTPQAADNIDTTIAHMLRRHPDGIALLGVSRPGVAVVPPGEVRERLAEMFRRYASGVRCIATVIGGEGFVAATKRTVVATIAMIARQPIPLQIFEERPSACRWVHERLAGVRGRPSSVGAFEDALANLEARYDAYLTSA